MRWLLVLLLAACRTAPECTVPLCEPACDQAEAELRALIPPGGDLLSPQEGRALMPDLAEIRLGVRAAQDGLRVCRGSSRCDEPLPPSETRPEPGEYLVTGQVTVPTTGTWTVEFWKVCSKDDKEISRSGGPMPIRASAETNVVDLGVLDRVRLGPRRSTSHETTCIYSLKSSEGVPFELQRMLVLPATGTN